VWMPDLSLERFSHAPAGRGLLVFCSEETEK
jgi:hypothetical protein